jgi:hypothetical protein
MFIEGFLQIRGLKEHLIVYIESIKIKVCYLFGEATKWMFVN